MSKYYIRVTISVIALILCLCLNSKAQGLKFYGSDRKINERTSFCVFRNGGKSFSGELDIKFSLCIYPGSKFGYILRIKDDKIQHKIWNLSYDTSMDSVIFRLNEEGKRSIVKVCLPRQEFRDMHWLEFEVQLDVLEGKASIVIDGTEYSSLAEYGDEKIKAEITFGKSDYMIDVPSFAIRNLCMKDMFHSYEFELKETKGNRVRDKSRHQIGTVDNPEWLMPESEHWRRLTSLNLDKNAALGYDQDRLAFYYYDENAIYSYNVVTDETDRYEFVPPCPMKIHLGMTYMHGRSLIGYEPFDASRKPGTPSICALNTDSMEWAVLSSSHTEHPVHHHSGFINPTNGRLTIFGGFGDKLYNGTFFYLDEDWQWHKDYITASSGDTIDPRYFVSTGTVSDTLFVFGGMGNESGEQIVGRRYYYDLHRIDLSTGRSEKLWNLDWEEEDMVPVRTMIIDNDKFFTLCYPEYKSQSILQLYSFSIEDGSWTKYASGIEISSDKMLSNSSLYYDEGLKKFFAAVVTFEDDIKSSLDIYSLSYPPAEANYTTSSQRNSKTIIYLFLSLIILSGGGLTIRKLRSFQSRIEDAKAYSESLSNPGKRLFKPTIRPNGIYVFGDFLVLDRNGKDITSKLNGQQRTIFYLLLKYSDSHGLSTSRLSNLIWPEKDEEKVKNSRGVALNNLRKILKDLDGVEIQYDANAYHLKFTKECYCDYYIYKSTRNDDPELINILSRGRFMKYESDPLFDDLKDQIDTDSISALIVEAKQRFANEEFRAAIEICEIIRKIEPLDEDAVSLQIQALKRIRQTEDARMVYASFVNEYRSVYGEEPGI